ncbi:hypothetical protein PROFUN_07090 [Planoprotostelium fungivorum]|uniref:FAD synthase n=1 Tax=Planoprotostelium fungivorum TaxID=1890364 RepID=A0A2P6NN72_9EUKA|nr:hypothetical protein PROFUN_07090 [Planoprotostelium fungivorum]
MTQTEESRRELPIDLSTYSGRVQNSISIIQKALDVYPLDTLAISFNGGKDCTALLHLIHQVLLSRDGSKEAKPCSHIRCVCFRTPNGFPDVDAFMLEAAQIYGIDTQIVDLPIKEGEIRLHPMKTEECEGLRQWISTTTPPPRAIFMGSRRTDPYCDNLHNFDETDVKDGWPLIMRVNPIIDWTYSDIWRFIQENHVPYCDLYDKGYTSLGAMTNTIPNPHLEKEDGSFLPAHQLKEGTYERAGRVSRNNQPK